MAKNILSEVVYDAITSEIEEYQRSSKKRMLEYYKENENEINASAEAKYRFHERLDRKYNEYKSHLWGMLQISMAITEYESSQYNYLLELVDNACKELCDLYFKLLD